MDKDSKPGSKPTGGKPKLAIVPPSVCLAASCKKKPELHEFCNEHFLWFKAGLVKKDGSYPKDFEKKFIQFIRKAA